MNYSVVYATSTGNTKLLADNVVEELGKNCVYAGQPNEKGIDADIVFVGFWTDEGICNKEIKEFLSNLKNKKLVLFGSAGAGSPEYLNMVLERTKSIIGEDCEVLDGFMCQGKMKYRVREKYELALEKNPDDENMKRAIKNFDVALSHPDDKDISRLKKMVNNIVKNK